MFAMKATLGFVRVSVNKFLRSSGGPSEQVNF